MKCFEYFYCIENILIKSIAPVDQVEIIVVFNLCVLANFSCNCFENNLQCSYLQPPHIHLFNYLKSITKETINLNLFIFTHINYIFKICWRSIKNYSRPYDREPLIFNLCILYYTHHYNIYN